MPRPAETSRVAKGVLRELRARGLLLQHGGAFPSVTTLVCGAPVAGSWWSHPQSNLVYWVLHDIEDCGEAVDAKLLDGKVTLVHRTLWPALYRIGSAREAWQMQGLTPLARALLAEAERGPQRVDRYRTRSAQKPGDAARLLERRLLVHATEVHTDSGKHAKVLSSWRAFWGELGEPEPALTSAAAKAQLEARVSGHCVRLPWR